MHESFTRELAFIRSIGSRQSISSKRLIRSELTEVIRDSLQTGESYSPSNLIVRSERLVLIPPSRIPRCTL